ncbi:hypothetical protein BH11PSE7_BH11PSE7_21310 [soil metagenome]
MTTRRLSAFPLLALFSAMALAAPVTQDEAVADLAHQWARITYQTPEAQKEAALRGLLASSRQVAQAYPARAEPLIWEAIILSSAAKAEGGLGALGKVKEARDLLLEAEKLSPGAMNGSALESLGTLYAKVPGWPLSFGDKAKARDYLLKALTVDPASMDANYFYADFLASQGEYEPAARYAGKALLAPPRPGREDADAGRRQDVVRLQADIRAHGDNSASK